MPAKVEIEINPETAVEQLLIYATSMLIEYDESILKGNSLGWVAQERQVIETRITLVNQVAYLADKLYMMKKRESSRAMVTG